MLDFSDQTYANILQRQLDRVTNTVDKREGSIVQTALGPESWYLQQVYLPLSKLQENAFALTAVGEFLEYKAAERGIYRRSATAAVREGVFDVPIPAGTRFSAIDGANSITFSTGEAMPSSDEYHRYRLMAERTGSEGNAYTGSLLPITPVTGLQYAQLASIVLAGTDEEDDDSLRNRYLISLEEQAFAGNIAAYQSAILEEDDIGAVQVYPSWPENGHVLCSILDANYDLATDPLIKRIQAKICPPEVDQADPSANGYGIAPIGAIATIRTGTEFPINVGMTVQLSPGFTVFAVRTQIEEAIENYLRSVRREWGNLMVSNKVEYPVFVYVSKLIVALLSINGIVNVTNLTLNGGASDITCTETGALQQVPVMGTVTINE